MYGTTEIQTQGFLTAYKLISIHFLRSLKKNPTAGVMNYVLLFLSFTYTVFLNPDVKFI